MMIQEFEISARPTAGATCSFEQLILQQIANSRWLHQTAERQAEIGRLESIARRACELDALGEEILRAVMLPKPADELDIPDFLRRY